MDESKDYLAMIPIKERVRIPHTLSYRTIVTGFQWSNNDMRTFDGRQEHHGINYFKTDHTKYRYMLARPYGIYVDIHPAELRHIPRYVTLNGDGKLLIHAGYAWDGPSGPTFDTRDFMRGSLVHDALYQLMREGQLNPGFREAADDELYRICLEDGMPRWRATYVYWAVRLFSGRYARPRKVG